MRSDLSRNGFSEKQVQAIFFKSSNSYPQCDLRRSACGTPDAYVGEQHLGNILRYLKCCTLDINRNPTTVKRYPNLKQVFLTSRVYGGYANGTDHGCLMPEPYSYESAFSVQRLVVAQIKQAAGVQSDDQYADEVDYDHAPWVDWGPYLWANGEFGRSDGLKWCNGQGNQRCSSFERDFRDGDLLHPEWWGDYTHPSAQAAEKVANQLVNFIGGNPNVQGSEWVTPWIGD